jgi:hypothetical protein
MDIHKHEKDEIALLRNAVIAVVDMAHDADSDQVKLAMDIFLAGVSQLGTIFQQRYVQLASQQQPRKAKPSKAAPQNGPQKPKRPQSGIDTPNARNDAEGRPKGQSRIMQGVQQADPTLADQQRALRGRVYGAQNDEVAFRKAAQAIVS